MMNNYYFKFQIGNEGFKTWLDTGCGEVCPLSIYFGKWRADEVSIGINQQKSNQAKEQIKTFYNLEKENDVNFWIFCEEKIYCLKKVGRKIEDGPNEYIYPGDGDLPKSINSKLIAHYRKIDLPEFFSNINANQKYNRGTIKKLNNSENEFAVALINNEKISIDLNNFYKYLSPTEFETLIFLIFSENNCLCSSFRGGTLKDYDLRVRLADNYFGLPKKTFWAQVKLKSNEKLNIDGYLISTQERSSLSEKIIGIDWIRERVASSNYIQRWLKNMIFYYKNILVNF
ncbi:hypothetical protein KJ586_00025 [Patescibacteria group bacterium]|nr:hypothetical protein [Patescibacteria group bacterium]MBU4454892.1 hypothetical protein [Patescibacteria group bacterium]